MTNISMGLDTYQRQHAAIPDIRFVNRFYEKDPTDLINGVAAIRRPGLGRRIQSGVGPIRAQFYLDGYNNGDMFIVSKDKLLRMGWAYDTGDTMTLCNGTIYGSGSPSIAARGDAMFIADGQFLQYLPDGSNDIQGPIVTPDDVVITSVTVVNSYVICTCSANATIPGDRFYWIQPGEFTIDPLNFATAESQPDIVLQTLSVSDQFWLFGSQSTEPWYFTGSPDAPVAPVTGRPYDRGIWEGTAVKIDDEVITVGADGNVYSVTSGAEPISTPGIAERILKAMQIAAIDG